jgi:acyl dehydratase
VIPKSGQHGRAVADDAKQSIFGEVIASGIHSAAIWRALDHEISGDIHWICGVAWEDVRWPNPVRAGDTVRARAEALAKRLSGKEPGRGIVEYRYTLLNQRDEIVFTCRSINRRAETFMSIIAWRPK